MQSISEHEAWKRVLEELPLWGAVCPAIVAAGKKHGFGDLDSVLFRRVQQHKWYRPADYIWPLTPRGNLCRRLFVERMIRETAV